MFWIYLDNGIPNKGCIWKYGVFPEHTTYDKWVDDLNVGQCIDQCRRRNTENELINAVSMFKADSDPGCYCVRATDGNDGASKYRSCRLPVKCKQQLLFI